MQRTDAHLELFSGWDSSLSELTDSPWTPALDGDAWQGAPADAGAQRAQQEQVWVEKLSTAAGAMVPVLEAQQIAAANYEAAPTENEVLQAKAAAALAKNSDLPNAPALEKEYLRLKDERDAAVRALELACADTQAALDKLDLPDITDDTCSAEDETTDPESDEDEDEDDPGMQGGDEDEDEDDPGMQGDPTTEPSPTDTTSPTPSPQRADGDTSPPAQPSPNASDSAPRIVMDAPPRTELSSSSSDTGSAASPKVYPNPNVGQQPTYTPQAQPPPVMATPSSTATAAPAQQQAYRPAPTPSHTQRETKVDGSDPISLVGAAPVATPVPAHAPMPSSTVSSPSTSLSSSSSAPTAPTAAAPSAAPGAAPVGGAPAPIGAGSKPTTSHTKIIAADQPTDPEPDKGVKKMTTAELYSAVAALMTEIDERDAAPKPPASEKV
ncbi:hypothetical protein [Mycolicibacterium fallax]|uniref:Uncharacterized protein n=1 Tax=Mycolicibacterium fallax TaxID=1793 RepID=A0A1X1RFQ6_MYCFA|nr:hypothetical protein [Mycolicibacterium fallax]ORV04615.1 hypothetical protein AWC04_08460 [Mycolicibacterium fallax]BBY99641.1 hypothetical protein MFAL_31080 [Mycolicibacterium fallax]